jgi:cyclic pyranopterin phosphate synthase
MPEEGVFLKQHEELISFEQIVSVVKYAVKIGFKKFRLTGGEPLVRNGIVKLVSMIKNIDGVEIIGMTTNGVNLKKYAKDLKEAGLTSLNISMDTLIPERYAKITRIGDISHVLEGIEAAIKVGFPIKINTVVMNETSEKEIEDLRNFCYRKGLTLQLINHYDLKENKKQKYIFDRPPNCALCNRIRLLSDGTLKPCLHSDLEIDIDWNNIEKSLIEAITKKPAAGSVCLNRSMIEIGG